MHPVQHTPMKLRSGKEIEESVYEEMEPGPSHSSVDQERRSSTISFGATKDEVAELKKDMFKICQTVNQLTETVARLTEHTLNMQKSRSQMDGRSVQTYSNVQLETSQEAIHAGDHSEFLDRREESTADVRENADPVRRIKIPRGGWITNPFGELSFSGREDRNNPMRFLLKFQRIADHEEMDEADRRFFFSKCLKDQALDWFDTHDFSSFTEVIKEFKTFYWGEDSQAKFRQFMYTGRYHPKPGWKMSDYFMIHAKEAQMLTPPMSTLEIIRSLRRHFDLSVARELRPSITKTLEDVVNILDDIEAESKSKIPAKDFSVGKPKSITKPEVQQQRFERPRSQVPFSPAFNRFSTYHSQPRMNYGVQPQYRRSDQSQPVSRATRPTERERPAADTRKEFQKEQRDWKPRPSTSKGKAEDVSIVRMKNIIEDLEEEDDSVRSKSEPLLMIKVNELLYPALFDTGAAISAVRSDVIKKIESDKCKFKRVATRKVLLTGAFGKKGEEAREVIQIPFHVNGVDFIHEFFVVANLLRPFVIGVDFMAKHPTSIIFESGRFLIDFPESSNGKPIACIDIKNVNIEKCNLLLDKYTDLFSNELGLIKNYQHVIEMNDSRPFKGRLYPIPDKYKNETMEYMKNLELDGVISKAPTQYVNPLVVVIKKNGDIRLCLDARELNKRMTNDHAQPPTIDEIFSRIGYKKYFTTLDVAKAFWQIPLDPDSRKYTGFLFNNQTYVFNRLPFGLKTSGGAFSRAIDQVLNNEHYDNVITYLDDILIATETVEKHFEILEDVLNKLQANGFKLNREKCVFLKTEVEFLGHKFSELTAEINESTKEAIVNFKRPKNKKTVQSFLGLINWDRRFVRNLSCLTRPLELLLKKNQSFKWTKEAEDAFIKIKQEFANTSCLYLSRPDMTYAIETDASTVGLGARLFQIDDNGNQFTIAYASRSVRQAESKYSITELEGLALVWALKKWKVVLLGRKVKVFTDHKALQFLTSCAIANIRIARWVEFLQEFDLDIIHIEGKSNKIADALSRNPPDKDTSVERNKLTIGALITPDEGLDTEEWVELMLEAQTRDIELNRLLVDEPDKYIERDGLIRKLTDFGDRIVVPNEISWELIERVHKFLLHFGTDKIISFVREHFIIENMIRIVKDVVASCLVCQATKIYTRPTRGREYYDLPEKPKQVVSIDIFGPLPTTNRGYKYVLVLMDVFSKFVKLYPMKNQKVQTIRNILQNKYFNEVGIPDEILSDRGGQFNSAQWREFAELNQFGLKFTSPYNPQSNPVERVMREIGRVLRVFASGRHYKWNRILRRAEQTFNSTVHISTGARPVDLMEGQVECLEIDDRIKPLPDRQLDLEERIELAKQILRRSAQKRGIQAQKHGIANQYQSGDMVWIKTHRLSDKAKYVTSKLFPVYDGPYKVRDVIRENAYLIEKLDGDTIGVYNSRQLRPHRRPQFRRYYAMHIAGIELDLKRDENKKKNTNNLPETVGDATDSIKVTVESENSTLEGGPSSSGSKVDLKQKKPNLYSMMTRQRRARIKRKAIETRIGRRKDNVLENISKMPFWSVRFGNKDCTAWFDTGSDMSIIGKKDIDYFKKEGVVIIEEEGPPLLILSPLNDAIEISTKFIEIPINVLENVYTHKVRVIEGEVRGIILGNDFMAKFGVKIDFANRSIEVQNYNSQAEEANREFRIWKCYNGEDRELKEINDI